MDPYYIFPREIWEMIYNQVEHPEDKLNLMRAHPNLSNQFGGIEKEEQLLFPSALTYVLTHMESSGRQLNNEEREELRKVFLACRLVSSFSCVAVDKWVESYWEKSTGDHQPPSCFQSVRLEPYFTTTLLDKFLEDFQNDACKTRTPLWSRVATFPVSMFGFDWMRASRRGNARAFERKWDEKRVAVFKKIGPHLKKLQVRFSRECFDNLGLWLAERNSVQKVLELTPNLKSLIFTYPGWNMGTRLRSNPQHSFPALPHLDHLKINDCCKMLFKPSLASMQAYFPHLKELEIGVVNLQDEHLTEGLFPELKLLKMTESSTSFPEMEERLKKIFKRISAPNLTLVEVKFDVEYYSIEKLEELKKTALLCLNKNPVYSRPEPELQWEVAAACDNHQRITLTFSRNINQGQDTKDQPA